MKNVFYILFLAAVISILVFVYPKVKKFIPFYDQISHERVGVNKDIQPKDQKNADYVGSIKCKDCHKDKYDTWSHSRHPKMIQNVKQIPTAIVADFSKLPKDANFALKDIVYTVGGKFKQRYMIRKDFNGSEDYVLGNYQWNVETKKWQKFKPWKYWYKEFYPHKNDMLPTSRACDGCHFVGFMAYEKRVESGIGCESCHGPGSEHIKNPKNKVFLASLADPVRQNEVCLQCHMRNRDKRLGSVNPKELWMEARDYPYGYMPGKPLAKYKKVAPFNGKETKEFYANGMGKKNRTQGNEFVHSIKGKHGITCINCHNPHSLEPTAEKNDKNDLCMKCHSFNSPIGPHEKDLVSHTHHKADSKGSLCVECHMPKVGRHTGKSPLSVRSHLFGFVTPEQTKKYNMPKETNACYACHKDKTLDQLQQNLEDWGMVSWDKR